MGEFYKKREKKKNSTYIFAFVVQFCNTMTGTFLPDLIVGPFISRAGLFEVNELYEHR